MASNPGENQLVLSDYKSRVISLYYSAQCEDSIKINFLEKHVMKMRLFCCFSEQGIVVRRAP
jgi:hypothetical protein